MFKACSRCGRIHDVNHKCNVGKTYQGGEERKLRATYAWTKKSLETRESAQHLCQVCRDKGIFTYKNLEVHHIETVKDKPEKLLDNDNLVVLCTKHHKLADAGKIDKEYLKRLARERG